MKKQKLFSKPIEPPEPPDDPYIVFVVIRTGVYRHEIGGVFTKREEAKKAIKILYSKEPDTYHNYVIQPVKLNTVAEFEEAEDEESYGIAPGLIELEASIIYRRSI